jgi:hypothetical protein
MENERHRGIKIPGLVHRFLNPESSHLFPFLPEIKVFYSSIRIFFIYSSLHLHDSYLSNPVYEKISCSFFPSSPFHGWNC